MRRAAGLLVAATVALSAGVAQAEPIGPNEGETQIAFGCTPDPIQGTVAYSVSRQARETNNQLYGAAGFAERVVFPRLDQKSAGGWRDREAGTGIFAFDVNVINGAAYVPSRETGSDCPPEFGYLQHRTDLYAAATGFGAKFGPVGLFYVATVTGSDYATRVGSGFLPYAYGLGAAFGGYLAPFQPRFLNYEEELRSRATDYIAGAQIDVWTLGAVRMGYVGSKGGFFQASGKIVKLFGSSAIRDFSDLSAAEYLKAGLDRQSWGRSDTARRIGATSLYARRLRYRPSSAVRAADGAATNFSSLHFQQASIGDLLDLDVAMGGLGQAEPFLHVGRVGLHTPGFRYVQDLAFDSVAPGDLALITRDEFVIDFGVNVGRVELPPLPYYGVMGGGKFTLDGQVVAWADLDGLLIALSFAVRYNTPEFLEAFPYAQDAVNSTFSIRLMPLPSG